MIHSCVNVDIEDYSNGQVNILQPYYSDSVSMRESTEYGTVIIGCDDTVSCSIENTSTITIMLEWVCGIGYAEYYLRVTPTETMWVTIEYDVEYCIRSNANWILQ